MKTSHALRSIVTITALVLLLGACGPTGTQVRRVDPGTDIDLSGNWNAGDNRRVAEWMVESSTQGAWLRRFQEQSDRLPAIQLSRVEVVSSGDIINTTSFLNAIRNAFINSGKATVVATLAEADLTREILADQDLHASDDTRKEQFQETGTDFILHGRITIQDDQAGRRRVKMYYVDLSLTNVQTRQQVWADRKEIMKDVQVGRYR